MKPASKSELLKSMLEAKAQRRVALAALPIEEKWKILLTLQERARMARTKDRA
jgi:hypothetical protein